MSSATWHSRSGRTLPGWLVPDLPGHRLADCQADAEPCLVHGVRRAVGVGIDRPVGEQSGRQLVERLGRVNTPDDLAQAGSVLHGWRQARIVRRAELDDLPGLGREPGAGAAAVEWVEAEVGEEPRAFLQVGHAIHDPFHTHDRHGWKLRSASSSADEAFSCTFEDEQTQYARINCCRYR